LQDKNGLDKVEKPLKHPFESSFSGQFFDRCAYEVVERWLGGAVPGVPHRDTSFLRSLSFWFLTLFSTEAKKL